MDTNIIFDNWQWILLGFYVVEKIVKISPTKKDDILFDMILKPFFSKMKEFKGIKKVLVPFMLVLMLSISAHAEMKPVSLIVAWDGKDVSGQTELSFPVTLKCYDAVGDVLVSQANVNGSVTNYQMPSFEIEVKDNVSNSYIYYATATDNAGNVSTRSVAITKIIVGKDTIPPSSPSIFDMIVAFFKRVFRFIV